MVPQSGDRRGGELHTLVDRSILAEFLPTAEKTALEILLRECDITPGRSSVLLNSLDSGVSIADLTCS